MNSKWDKQSQAVKATQVAFELEQKISRKIHELAAKEGLNPSSQIKKMIGLPYSPPKRPRLTISLTAEDYETLGDKYNLNPQDTLDIKRKIMEELLDIIE